MAAVIQDGSWLRRAFLLPKDEVRPGYGTAQRPMVATSAAYKYTNAKLGGNWAVNNPPQFTRYADIRQPGLGRGPRERNEGMGRYYSEAFDDTRQVIHMSFGVPRFNSWVNYFTSFYDREMALLANTGRSSRTFYELGRVGGFIVTLPLQPFIIGASATNRVYQFLTNQRPSKWYYFKPNMHAYWTSVNTIANEIAINMGLIPRVFNAGDPLQEPGARVTEADLSYLHSQMPDLFRPGGGVDILALANKTQRMADESQRAVRQMRESATSIEDLHTKMQKFANSPVVDPRPDIDSRQYFLDYINAEGEEDGSEATSEHFSTWSQLSGVSNFLTGSLRAGSQFATFRVNHRGSVQESFSNTVRDSDIAQTVNSKVAQGRSWSFNLMGGNITPIVGSFFDAIKSFGAGLLDSVSLGGLATLAGTAFMDVPKMWDGSTTQLPRAEYTIPLYGVYGNKISRFINMYIPISMVLASGMALSAGRAAYTSPFICQIYHEGRIQCQLGMVDNITLTRGTGNVGWNTENEMLGAELTISVVDLSSIMHMPIKGSFGGDSSVLGTGLQAAAAMLGESAGGDAGGALALAATGAGWDEQSAFSDYMAVLGGLPVSDSFYTQRRLNLSMTRSLDSFRRWKSPSNWMSQLMNAPSARALSQFAQTTDRF